MQISDELIAWVVVGLRPAQGFDRFDTHLVDPLHPTQDFDG
jgi:hypothetical protein